MAQSTKTKTKNTAAPKVEFNKKLNINSKKKKIIKSAASRAAQKDFTIDDLHQNQQQELSKRRYEKELKNLFLELVKLQEWVVTTKARVVIIFEGRDAAGKGGVIKRISEPLNPRVCRIAALGTPSPKEKTQWYFQRYVSHLPAGGEIVLFDRSWYNRAGV
jgi:polyphosphate kinase 2 (PPK2 family)